MINWIKNILSKQATADEVEEAPVKIEEKFARVTRYNVDEAGIGADDIRSTTVNVINMTGVDP